MNVGNKNIGSRLNGYVEVVEVDDGVCVCVCVCVYV